MEKLICITAICPLRKSPFYESEIVSQLLFGETAVLLEVFHNFFKVKCEFDNYEGWCMANQVNFLSTENTVLKGFVTNHSYWALLNEHKIYLPLGCPVIEDIKSKNYSLSFPQQNYLAVADCNAGPEETIHYSNLFKNAPYLWGGRSSYGIDCSGFAQQVFKLMGINLPRDAWQQAKEGEMVEGIEKSKTGDLAFFKDGENKIIHVGILLNASSIIHAAGYVHIDSIDQDGIIHYASKTRTHHLNSIKRFF